MFTEQTSRSRGVVYCRESSMAAMRDGKGRSAGTTMVLLDSCQAGCWLLGGGGGAGGCLGAGVGGCRVSESSEMATGRWAGLLGGGFGGYGGREGTGQDRRADTGGLRRYGWK